jgi:hypothetical protein
MGLPNFSGETSLYNTPNSYRPGFSSNGGILPQLMFGPNGCIPGCVCVTFENCPCCNTLWDFVGGEIAPFPGRRGPVRGVGNIL